MEDYISSQIFATAVLTVMLGLIVTGMVYFSMVRTARALVLAVGHKDVLRRLSEIEAENARLSQQVVPIPEAFQATLIQKLTHFHTPEIDGLMRKLMPYRLTAEEFDRLIELLDKTARDMASEIDDEEREAAMMLPMVMKRVRANRDKTGLEAEPLIRIIVTTRADVRDIRTS
jgi:hypothetical protein